jgi:hypothetical protein
LPPAFVPADEPAAGRPLGLPLSLAPPLAVEMEPAPVVLGTPLLRPTPAL